MPLWTAVVGALTIAMAGIGFAVAPGDDGNGPATITASAVDAGPLGSAFAAALEPTDEPTASPEASPLPTPDAEPTGVPTGTTDPATGQARPPAGGGAPPVSGGGRIPGGLSGISAGTLSQVNAWEAFRGSPVTVVQTFAARNSWNEIINPWLGSGPEKFSNFPGKWVISQPFFPNGGGDMASCANGAYTEQWKQFGTWLVNRGRPDTIVRLAWEFNGDWFPWSVSKTDPATWKRCFQVVVSAIRSTDPQVRIDWTINAHSPNAFENYPGDAYVDIIGIDTYDHWPPSRDQATWDQQCNHPTGLCSVIRFARDHGKQFSVPEWGLVATSDTGAGRAGQAGGDNPFFIQKMYETFRANADVLAYEAYFNDSAPGNVHSSLINPTTHPNAAATYASLW
ncbi:MAG: hypothetical protein IRZ08_14745 [Frankia sp.]|nr:hypothetical protein [Frankia sp.]